MCLSSRIRPESIIRYETGFIVRIGQEMVGPDGAMCRIDHECISPTLRAFLDIFMPQEY